MKLSYLGPEGTFSHDAAAALAARLGVALDLEPQVNVEAVARSAAGAQGGPTFGLVPYYNFLEGLVQEHLDLIYELKLQIIGALRLPVELAAGTFGGPDAPAGKVYSHPKALAQVSEFIHARFKDAAAIPVASTSEAARIVSADKDGVAIASESALKRFGVPIVARDIGNRRQGVANFTDFFVVRAEGSGAMLPFGEPDRTMIAVTPHVDRLGLLAELLGQFHFYELDIAKIHSRPAIDRVEGQNQPQMFYLEVLSAPDAEPLRRCLDAILYRFGEETAANAAVRVMGAFRI